MSISKIIFRQVGQKRQVDDTVFMLYAAALHRVIQAHFKGVTLGLASPSAAWCTAWGNSPASSRSGTSLLQNPCYFIQAAIDKLP